jgi:hypothetical protein
MWSLSRFAVGDGERIAATRNISRFDDRQAGYVAP